MTDTSIRARIRAVPDGPPDEVRSRARRPLRRDGLWPLVFAGPLVLGITVFYFWPIVQTFGFSFTDFGSFGGSTFAGWDNYVRLVTDPLLYRSLFNTLLFTALSLLGVPIAVYLANLLNRPGLRFAGLYRVLYVLPYIVMPTAIAVIWRAIFGGDNGILNHGLGLLGIDGPYWLSDPGVALYGVAIVAVWSSIGFGMIVISAALKTIPAECYEAAELDGASRWRQFVSITVPLIVPTIGFLSVITIITSFQLFDLLFALLGPTNPALPANMSLVYFFYQQGFVDNERGYAAAIAMVIFLVIGLLTFAQLRLQRRWADS